jgi:hypothetical protein
VEYVEKNEVAAARYGDGTLAQVAAILNGEEDR